jgi:hypothetical protein
VGGHKEELSGCQVLEMLEDSVFIDGFTLG